ncbi:hypothetical protein ABZ611_26260 [Streptomyces sp. NPDC007861]|uniref:hypothetical protein n=1 Tax=Streptomyces sp. NPDC007861 TaxID=3154893 RepID=UPI0033E10246
MHDQPPEQQSHTPPLAPGPQAPYPHYPLMPQTVMPRGVKIARVLLHVIGVLNALSGLLVLSAAVAASAGTVTGVGLNRDDAPSLYLIGVFTLALGTAAIVLAACFRTGRNRVRIGAITIGVLLAVNGLASLTAGQVVSGPVIVLGALVILNCRKPEAVTYFNRPGARWRSRIVRMRSMSASARPASPSASQSTARAAT